MWVEFVVFLRSSSLHKSNTSKFQFDQDRERACKPTKAGVDSSLYNVNSNAGTGHKSNGRDGGLRRRGHTEQL